MWRTVSCPLGGAPYHPMMDAQPAVPSAAIATSRATVIAVAGAVSTGLLMLPAVVNGFPFLFYDTGGYLDAAFNHVIKPGRSTVYGLLLQLGSHPGFWPVALLQCALCVWILGLLLRIHGLGGRPGLLIGVCALLTFSTALPFISGELMPDIFAGLGGFALYLLLWHAADLRRLETLGLASIIAIGGASHNSVLAIAILCIGAAGLAAALDPGLRQRLRLWLPLASIAAAVLLTPAANLLTAGQFKGTPGGTAFVFGRLLEDGIVARYLDDHCPHPNLTLCAMRGHIPRLADDFLWDDSEVFNAIGGFEGGEAEMRRIIIGSLFSYPLDNLRLAVRATLRQLVAVQTGDLMSEELVDSYDVIRVVMPAADAAMMAARQQQDPPIDFDYYSRLHVPVALAASLLIAVATLVAGWRGQREMTLFAGSVTVLLLANAAVCGIFSNPHDRYQSRIAWVAVAALFILAVRVGALYVARRRALRTAAFG